MTSKPGGRLAFWCGRDFGEDEFGPLWTAMAQHVPLPDPAEDDAPGPGNFTNREHITAVLTEAGFGDVAADPVETYSDFGRDAEDATEFIVGWGPVQHWLRDADPTSVAAARKAVAEALRPFETETGVRLRGPGWRFTAVRGDLLP